jgi:hypothetical protein
VKRLTIRAVTCVVLLCAPLTAAQGPAGSRQLLDLANEALRRNDVREYATLIGRAWVTLGNPEDQVDAGVALANFHWRIQHDPVKARAILEQARSLRVKPARVLLELARLEATEANFPAARSAARSALTEAENTLETLSAKNAYAGAVEEEIFRCELDRNPPAVCPQGDALVREGLNLVDPVVRDAPGLPASSRIDLLLALLSGRGPSALRAWRSYYRVAAGDTLTSPLAEPAATLALILSSFTADSAPGPRARVVRALAASRLTPEAALLAVHWKLAPDKDLSDVIQYARWIRALKFRLDEDYRQRALGKADDKRFLALFTSQAEALWSALEWAGKPDAFALNRFTEEIGRRFGALIRLFPGGVSFGHRVRDENLHIDQYGRTATLHFVVIDSMVSNGYTSWLWDGRASIGGWAEPASATHPSTIVEVRSDSSISAWNAVSEPAAIARIRDTVIRQSQDDELRARQNPYAYLPGLSARMAQRGRERLLNRLKTTGLAGAELRASFLSEYEKAHQAAGIIAHEGRHALDLAATPGMPSEELEFRAKLSEVAFAPEPLLALGGIFDSNIGLAGDAHGMANARIMKGLVAWLAAHGPDIPSLDRSHPLLPQFDRLTDDQMRAAFRSMDPWTKPPS